ncbi:MAG: hypothetical protein AAF830_00515 [Pseudomonadota bacterium]
MSAWLIIPWLLFVWTVRGLVKAFYQFPPGPFGLPRTVRGLVGKKLKQSGFRESERIVEGPKSHSISYENEHFTIWFAYDRHELIADLRPNDPIALPHDPSLPKTAPFQGDGSPPYSLWHMLAFVEADIWKDLGIVENHGELRYTLRFLADRLYTIEMFFEFQSSVYVPYRRSRAIAQQAYTWEMRGVYTDTPKIEADVLERCRRYFLQWRDDEDFISAANVLGIIEEALDPDELAELNRVRALAERQPRPWLADKSTFSR